MVYCVRFILFKQRILVFYTTLYLLNIDFFSGDTEIEYRTGVVEVEKLFIICVLFLQNTTLMWVCIVVPNKQLSLNKQTKLMDPLIQNIKQLKILFSVLNKLYDFEMQIL